MKINIGCGNKVKEGFVGVDKYACDAAEIICDATEGLPFHDDEITAVYMDNFIEHVQDIPALMKELVRVCCNGAEITIITPHFTSLSSWKDPTHVHHLSFFSFDHFEKSSVAHYIGGGLTTTHKKLSFGGGISGLIGRLLFTFSAETYERKFCFMFRASTLTVQLRVDK